MPTQLDRNATARRLEQLLADSLDDPVQPNCRGEDPELFFPRSQAPAVARDAIKVCNDCPMKGACLAYAMDWNVDGVWGATTKPERDRRRAELGHRPLPMRVPAALATARISNSGSVTPARIDTTWCSECHIYHQADHHETQRVGLTDDENIGDFLDIRTSTNDAAMILKRMHTTVAAME